MIELKNLLKCKLYGADSVRTTVLFSNSTNEYNVRLLPISTLLEFLALLSVLFLKTPQRANVHVVQCDMHDDDTPCDFPTIRIICKVFGMKNNRIIHTLHQ